MKKLITLMLTVIMAFTVFTAANAQVGNDPMDMDHNTAIVWLDDDPYVFGVSEVYEKDGVIYVGFESNSGEELVMAMLNDLEVNVYGADGDAVYSVVMRDEDGVTHKSVCSDKASRNGNGCDIVVTAWDEDDWYQIIILGTSEGEENGEHHELLGAFDFIYDSGHDAHDHANEETAAYYCGACSGTGSCRSCRGGRCTDCRGGWKSCYCGTGRCTICYGTGSYGYGMDRIDCAACDGTGRHDYCNGSGSIPCMLCDGYGNCRICYGTGECQYCHYNPDRWN